MVCLMEHGKIENDRQSLINMIFVVSKRQMLLWVFVSFCIMLIGMIHSLGDHKDIAS